jgi:hypothetical protein
MEREAYMPKNDIRLYTRLIVRNGNEYLVGRQVGTGVLRWSRSPWDAWWTRTRIHARVIAEKTGSDVFLFNPITGQLRNARIQ